MAIPIPPDTKDWTWVLERPCPDCGFDAAGIDHGDLSRLVRANAVTFVERVALEGAGERPAPAVWSPLEYACHVRDVHGVFAERVRLMLDQEDPLFPNWDQDATARAGRYADQDPSMVGAELVAAAHDVARVYDGVEDWTRPGRRSNGSVFTIDTLGRYHLHDVVHHAWDVRAR